MFFCNKSGHGVINFHLFNCGYLKFLNAVSNIFSFKPKKLKLLLYISKVHLITIHATIKP